MLEIKSPDNPKIKLYRKLTEGRKYRAENGLFTFEGARLIADAAKEKAPVKTVFVTEKFLQSGTIPKFENAETYLISEELGKKISSTDTAQGIFAVCRTFDDPPAVRAGGSYVVLHNLQDPGNLGTVIRTADAVGADGVFLSGCCDLFSPKTVRATMGSLFRVKIGETALDELFPRFEQCGVPTCAAVVDGDALSLTDCDFSAGGAVLIGNEGNGLPTETADRCDRKITIKMRGNANSLNAAMAAGIIMWELTKAKG